MEAKLSKVPNDPKRTGPNKNTNFETVIPDCLDFESGSRLAGTNSRSVSKHPVSLSAFALATWR